MEHFADRLVTQCREKGTPICVGLDPVYERLPRSLRAQIDATSATSLTSALESFCEKLLDVLAPHVACVKVQIACFERYRWPGVQAYFRVVAHAQRLGLIVIGDAKRGDIGISAAHYAAGNLADPICHDLGDARGPDALTINTYLGTDSIEPFLQVAAGEGKGLFALVRTSNPGGDSLQSLPLADGGTVAERVASMVEQLGKAHVGQMGYSLLGAVVGATKADDAVRLRQLMPQQIFLVPGFGAQGASVQDVKACFMPDGSGAIISASRSIIYAYDDVETQDWIAAVEDAALRMKEQLANVVT